MAGSSRYYRPELDLLRFFAFLLVFLSHVVPGDVAFYEQSHIPLPIGRFVVAFAAGGSWGVDLFFALSAYLITTLLLRERHELGRVDVGSFYVRRALRIWPLYFVFLLGALPLIRGLFPGDQMSGKYLLAFALFVGNWACTLWGYPHSIAGQLWSVSIEEQFYLTWPLILRRFADHMMAVACILLVVAFAARGWLVSHGAVHPQIWCNTLARLDPIAGGALLAVYVQRRAIVMAGSCRVSPPGGAAASPGEGGHRMLGAECLAMPSAADRTLRRSGRVALLVCGLLGFAALGQFGDFAGRGAMITFPAGAVACMALLIAVLGASLPTRGVLVAILIYLGRISYGLYVFHLVFIDAFGVAAAHDPLGRLARIGAALAATIAAAGCSYRFLEMPFLRLKGRFTHIATAPPPSQ
ncbi:MAG: acyltransferase [Proteobacteria bacterium]|nr:acyltransferase [Pseudomonadota bacterium]